MMGGLKSRYALYGLVFAAGALVFLWPEEAPIDAVSPAASAGRQGVAALPPLTALAESGSGETKRNLFAPAGPAAKPPPPPPPPAAPAAAPPPPPPPDRFAGVKIVGVVARDGRTSVLVEAGGDLRSVEAGQPFGQDEALTIGGIEGRTVQVTDGMANVTKTFLLSEE